MSRRPHSVRIGQLAMVFAFLALALSIPVPRAADAQTTRGATLTGYFHIDNIDYLPKPGQPRPAKDTVRYVLQLDNGGEIGLKLSDRQLRDSNGGRALWGRRVEVTSKAIPANSGNRRPNLASRPALVESIRATSQAAPAGARPQAGANSAQQLVGGAKPFVTLLCRFADQVGVTPQPRSYFQALMGNMPGGMDHYFRESSYGALTLAGSTVIEWVDLPHGELYYAPDSDTLNATELAQDCAAAADAQVHFPSYFGVNIMVNTQPFNFAMGSSRTLTLDGQTRHYGFTWNPPFAYNGNLPNVVGHEMGHSMGLWHSSGPYGQVYDSKWDIMSDGGTCTTAGTSLGFGCIAVHHIAYQKDVLGWLPSASKYTATPGSSQQITLQDLGSAGPTSGNYLMAKIPINGSTQHYYTVEARRQAGVYEGELPGTAVVIHRVNTARIQHVAQVMDNTNGNPNDAGAMWVVGETFKDDPNGISVTIDQDMGNGFKVTVAIAASPSCTVSVTPSPVTVPVGGSTNSVSVTASTGGCVWVSVSHEEWLSFNRAIGTGNATVTWTADSNSGAGADRAGQTSIGEDTVVFNQANGGTSCAPTTQAIAVGQTVNGSLANTDGCSVLYGTSFYADHYTFFATAGQQVAISYNSSAFDAFLDVFTPTGVLFEEDDNGGGGTNARVPAGGGFITISITGTWRIEVSSFGFQEIGNYSLTLSAPSVGMLRATTNPAVPSTISIDGVARDIWALTWMELPPGSYTVSFSDVPGFASPKPQTVTITAGMTTTVQGNFTALGFIRVLTNPALNAVIFVDNVPVNNYGTWSYYLPTPTGATYRVCGGPVAGFTTPACQNVTVTAGNTTTVTLNYTGSGPNLSTPDDGAAEWSEELATIAWEEWGEQIIEVAAE